MTIYNRSIVEQQESRLRHAAARKGLRLKKSRSRRPHDPNFGGYMLVDDRNCVVRGGNHCAFSETLDDIRAYLTKSDTKQDDDDLAATFDLADKFIDLAHEGCETDADVQFAQCVAQADFIAVTCDSDAGIRNAVRELAEDILRLALDQHADRMIAAAQSEAKGARLQ